jgi:hypothetical protein
MATNNNARQYFLLVAGAFSLALLIKQSLTLCVDRKKQLINITILISFSCYVIIHMIRAWMTLENNTTIYFDYAVKGSTILYNISICSILYLSMTRAACFFQTGTIKTVAENCAKAFTIGLLVIRNIRTAMIFTNYDSTSGRIAIVPIIQLATLFVILILRAVFDISSLYAIFKINKQAEGFFQTKNDYSTKRAVQTLILNLIVELMFSALAIFVAVLEAIPYTGTMIAFADWYLISWSIASAVEQRQLYRIIFRTETSSEGQRSKASKKVKGSVKNV